MKRQYSLTTLAILALGTFSAAQQCPSGRFRDAAGDCVSVKSSAPSTRDVTQNWPMDAKNASKALKDKYGNPDESSRRAVSWNDRGDFSKITVYRDATTDNVPTPHQAYLEHQVRYTVPAFRAGDLQNFDKSLVIDGRNGTLASRSDSERSNILALNLADQIVTGKITVADAQNLRAKTEALNMAGKTTALSDHLEFTPDSPGEPHAIRALPPY